MGLSERAKDSIVVVEKDVNERLTESNFVNDGRKLPETSIPRTSSSSNLTFVLRNQVKEQRANSKAERNLKNKQT